VPRLALPPTQVQLCYQNPKTLPPYLPAFARATGRADIERVVSATLTLPHAECSGHDTKCSKALNEREQP
jgi:hypothetical protein